MFKTYSVLLKKHFVVILTRPFLKFKYDFKNLGPIVCREEFCMPILCYAHVVLPHVKIKLLVFQMMLACSSKDANLCQMQQTAEIFGHEVDVTEKKREAIKKYFDLQIPTTIMS